MVTGTEHTPTIRHVVMTRLGIGIARPSFYKQHLELLRIGLYKSMAAQTSQNFEWYVCVDQQIDSDTEAQLRALLSSHDNFFLFKLDPIATGKMIPAYSLLPPRDVQDDARIILSRVDDDDLIHRDTIKNIQDFVMARPSEEKHLSVCHGAGIYAYIGDNTYTSKQNPTLALCLSTVSTPAKVIEPYGFNHNHIAEVMAQHAGQHYVLNEDAPHWVYTQYAGSDSFSDKPTTTGRAVADATCTNVFLACGVEGSWMEDVQNILNTHPDEGGNFATGYPKMRKLSMKLHLLRMIKRHPQKDSDEFYALVHAFYAI